MNALISRLSLASLSTLILLGCAGNPVLQTPAGTSALSAAVSADKLQAMLMKISEDDQAFAALQTDPKAYLKAEGISLPDEQKVKLLEVGSKLYLVLDERNLQLLQPEFKQSSQPKSETAQKFAAIRAKAANDPAFKTNLLSKTAQTLEQEGLSDVVAAITEVVDYQPNVNLLLFYRGDSEITRGSGTSGWNANEFKLRFTNGGSENQLPTVFHDLTISILDKNLGQNAPPYKDTSSLNKALSPEVLNPIAKKWYFAMEGSCTASFLLISPKFCATVLAGSWLDGKSEFSQALLSSFKTMMASPNSRQELKSLMPDVEKRYHDILNSYKTLKPKLISVTAQNRPFVITEIRQILAQFDNLNTQLVNINRNYHYILSYIYPKTTFAVLIDDSIPTNGINLEHWYHAAEKVRAQLKSRLDVLEAEEKAKS